MRRSYLEKGNFSWTTWVAYETPDKDVAKCAYSAWWSEQKRKAFVKEEVWINDAVPTWEFFEYEVKAVRSPLGGKEWEVVIHGYI